MKAWGETHNTKGKILMLGDPFCKFTKSIGAEIDRNDKGLGMRSSRYTMLVEKGIVTKIKEESNTADCEISAAENFLKEIQFLIASVASLSANSLYLFPA